MNWISLLFPFGIFAHMYDVCNNVTEILDNHNLGYEIHKVTTIDGYILSIFRILGQEGATAELGKPPVVFQHGISGSPNCFIENGNSSIPFYLVNRGFDVWLASGRGTQYSKEHLKYKYDSVEFWNFTFEDLGMKDSRAYIGYIYNLTKQKVAYFSVSQGFMQIMAAFTLDPTYFQERVNKIIGWGAVVRPDLSGNPFTLIGSYGRKILPYLGITHMGEFSKESCLFHAWLCKFSQAICRLLPMFNGDFLPYVNNPNTIYTTDIASIRGLDHLSYNVLEKGFFRHPMYGERVKYDLKKIKGVQIGIAQGDVDMMASEANAKWLEQEFKENGNFRILGRYKAMGHTGFLIRHHMFEHYTDTLRFLQE